MGKEARVYLDVSIGGSRVGRVEIQLFAGLPKTTENFRSLCTGERGLGRTTGKALHYRKVPFHRVIKGFMLQSGDFSQRNGTGGESIYGGKFEDEGFTYRHSKAGLLSMANAGKNTNGSQFFITTAPTPHLDGKHVVFGEVVSGMDVVRNMDNVETVANDKPASMQTVMIEDCGELDGDSGSSSDEEDPDERKRRKASRKEKKKLKKQEKKEKKRSKKEMKRAKKEAKKRRHDEDGDAKMQKRHRRDDDRVRSRSRDGDESKKRDGREEVGRRENSRSPSRSTSRDPASRSRSHRDPAERKRLRSRGGSRSPSNSRNPRSSREASRGRGDNGYARSRRSLSRERHQRHSRNRSRSRSHGRSNMRGSYDQRSDRRHRRSRS